MRVILHTKVKERCRWMYMTCKCRSYLFGREDRRSTAALVAEGVRLQSKLSPLSMCVRPYPSHITQCKPIVTSHSLRAWGKRKSLQEKTNVLSLFPFVHMFLTKKEKAFSLLYIPLGIQNKIQKCVCAIACSVLQFSTRAKSVRPDEEWAVQTQWQFCDLCRCFSVTPLLHGIEHWSLFKKRGNNLAVTWQRWGCLWATLEQGVWSTSHDATKQQALHINVPRLKRVSQSDTSCRKSK